jgi:N-acetylmuramoyl-L-alanine amidase
LKRYCFLSVVIASVVVLLTGCSPADKPATVVGSGLNGIIIMLDPGHGGVDHGAIGRAGTKEDILNLQVAMLVRDKLKQAGAQVEMTRQSADVDYSGDNDTRKRRDMDNRAGLIRASNANAIISIHMNKYPNRKLYGPQTFYWKSNDEGRKLANCIQDELLGSVTSYKKFRIVEGDYFILHVVDAPSALVECGFLSNSADEKRLQNADYQQKIAECIFRGICDYFSVQYQ